MKVILTKRVPKIGEMGEIKEVADGYAQNFLLPKGLARLATAEAIKEVETARQKAEQKAEADLVHAEKLVSDLQNQTIEISAKASEEGTLYASVSAAKIATELKAKGFEIDKSKIKAEHIKEVGEHEVVIDLDHGLEARITIVINSE